MKVSYSQLFRITSKHLPFHGIFLLNNEMEATYSVFRARAAHSAREHRKKTRLILVLTIRPAWSAWSRTSTPCRRTPWSRRCRVPGASPLAPSSPQRGCQHTYMSHVRRGSFSTHRISCLGRRNRPEKDRFSHRVSSGAVLCREQGGCTKGRNWRWSWRRIVSFYEDGDLQFSMFLEY